jgi:transcriptional regulator with XRE-family HTH domain
MIYDKVKVLCADRGISVASLEKALGMGNGTIGSWNDSSPGFHSIAKVAKYFDVPLEYFVDEEAEVKEGVK